ncbi:MAG TPA: aldehyde dehydrogenase family protein [Candidatus Dormibacteraeota bacterium]|nr:aldehyde dehydrogenase family protein [Candidatus Dormibacteraeota bacterium]
MAAFERRRAVPPRERGLAMLRVADDLKAEVRGSIDILRYFGGVAQELKGEVVPVSELLLVYHRRGPIGVVGDRPLNASLCVLRMAELRARHLPPGVLNVVIGLGEEAGAALAQRPNVRRLSFTGSIEAGKLIMHAAADRVVPVSLELGARAGPRLPRLR